ncbi:MAG: amino acid ABC transporter permease [Clostridia bacterium]|nr:amino acid ABC transporter permease [Clostridia bacterium]
MSFWEVTLTLLDGFKVTCGLFFLTLLFALPLGLLICFGTMSKFKPLRFVMKTIVWIVRGIPLMLQLFIFVYVPGMLFSITVPDLNLLLFGNEIHISSKFVLSVVAFSINYACYFSEIYRGGIESISKGQYEAGQVLGMTKSQVFFKIVLIQVIKRIVPPISNEVITLVKDTALIRSVAIVEIVMSAELLMAKTLIWPLFYTGVFYLVFVGVLTVLFNKLEKKLDYFKA